MGQSAELLIEPRARPRPRRSPLPSPQPRRRHSLGRTVLGAFIGSRAFLFATAAGTVLVAGFGPPRKVFEHAQLTRSLGAVGDVLLAGSARWDAAWYLLIARAGYAPSLGSATVARAAFYPLYPLLIRAGGALGFPLPAAGVLLSLIFFGLALLLLYRLTYLELWESFGRERADAARIASSAVLFCALFPMSFFFSAIYPEALFLCLSLALFWYARTGRLARAALAGALASATRPTGLALLLPALLLFLYGPKGRPGSAAPRRPGWQGLWLLLIPLGLGSFLLYLWLAGGSPTSPFAAEALWGRHFGGPFVALFDGISEGLGGAVTLVGGHPSSGAAVQASHNLVLLAFAGFAVVGAIGIARRLPLPYAAYVAAALLLPLSYPVSGEPLMSLPRFLLVLFPYYMWLALALETRPRLRATLLGASTTLLLFFTAAFATWHWVS